MIMTHHIHQTRFLTTLAAAILMVTLASTQAQTYTWADNAQGQLYLTCPNPNGPGYPDAHYYYPSNSYWSQSLTMGPDCDPNDGNKIVVEPSNWSPAPPVLVYPVDRVRSAWMWCLAHRATPC